MKRKFKKDVAKKKQPSSGELGNLYLPQCINYINVQTNGTRGDILRSHIKNEKRGRLTLLCTLWMRCKCAAHLATAGSRCDQSVVRNMAALLAVRICWEEHHCRWSHRHLITSCALTDTCMHVNVLVHLFLISCMFKFHAFYHVCVPGQRAECVHAHMWLQAANSISKRQVDLMENLFPSAQRRSHLLFTLQASGP